MTLALFIQSIEEDPLIFASVVFTVIISITLHELAHGWMAIRLGDRTPIELDRMNVNPLVHMGPWSLIALLLAGIAWGQMPIDASRMRGRFAEALVAVAGPLTNLLLGVLALTALGLWARFDDRFPIMVEGQHQVVENSAFFLWQFGRVNLILFVFNLLPIPPLDGSHILANFNRPYANFISNPANGGMIMVLFIFAFLFGAVLFTPAQKLGLEYLFLVSGIDSPLLWWTVIF